MSRELKKMRATVIFTAFALIVSIFALFSLNGSMAWMMGNRNVTASNLNVRIDDPNKLVETVEYHLIDRVTIETETVGESTSEAEDSSENTDGNTYVFSADAASSPSLKVYSSLIPARQVLIKIVLTENIPIRIDAVSEKNTSELDTPVDEPGDGAGNNLSNIIMFKPVSNIDSSGGSGIVINGSDCMSGMSFSSLSSGVPVFDASITVCESISPIADQNGKYCVYIIMDYNEKVAEYIEKNNANFIDTKFNEVTDAVNGTYQMIPYGSADFKLVITRSETE